MWSTPSPEDEPHPSSDRAFKDDVGDSTQTREVAIKKLMDLCAS